MSSNGRRRAGADLTGVVCCVLMALAPRPSFAQAPAAPAEAKPPTPPPAAPSPPASDPDDPQRYFDSVTVSATLNPRR